MLDHSPIEIQYLRNVEDALRFRQVRSNNRCRLVIVGGGVIGLEAACAAAKSGCSVTVIESEQRLLARAFPQIISDLIAAKHRSHGVEFVFGATVTGSTPDGVRLNNGTEIPADLVLVGRDLGAIVEADAILRAARHRRAKDEFDAMAAMLRGEASARQEPLFALRDAAAALCSGASRRRARSRHRRR